MKILESLSFSPKWFISIPGILITLGVILLIIALILLMTSKDKSEENGEVIDNNIQPTENTTVNPSAEQLENSVPEVQPIVTPSVTPEMQTVEVPNAMPEAQVVEVPSITPEPEVVPVQNVVSDVQSIQTQNVVPEVKIVETPNFVPEVQPVAPTTSPAPSIEIFPPKADETAQNVNQTVSIYGGANPTETINSVNTNEVKPVIYGGANPMENTSTIPNVGIEQNVQKPVAESAIETLDL